MRKSVNEEATFQKGYKKSEKKAKKKQLNHLKHEKKR